MEKKKFKNRIFAGLLALTLAGCKPALVSAENQLVQEDVQTELIEMFKTDYEITSPEMGVIYEHKYVSEDGKIEKWYVSYLPAIDGLKRTDEIRKINSVDGRFVECDIKEEHAHLYYNITKQSYDVPFYSEDAEIISNGDLFVKELVITQIDKEALEILRKYDLYRLSDNILCFENTLNYAYQCGYEGLAFIIPEKYDKKEGLTVRYVSYEDKEANYTEELNGYLIDPRNDVLTKLYKDASNEDKIKVLK